MRDDPSDPDQEEDDELDELVFALLDRYEAEGEAALDELCGAHPEHADALRARVATLRESGLLDAAQETETEAFPETLGEFRLLERLGGGGMGVVFLAEQTTLGRRVALKVIRPEQLFFEGARERFRREVEAVAHLAHPGIVPIYTVGEEGDVPYFAMEHVRGVTLGEVLERCEGRDPAELHGADLRAIVAELSGDRSEGGELVWDAPWTTVCLRLVRQVAEALEHAHRRGVLHRDVKPSNVMVTVAGRAQLFDFGLARKSGESRLTRTGSQLGSIPYMSPEQVRGDMSSPAIDVYGLGVALYELLTLRLPYRSSSYTELVQRILAGEPTPLRKVHPGIPADVETVCLTAMDVDPGRRYPSAEAFARDLTNLLERRPIEARRAGPFVRTLRWVQRRPSTAAAIGLTALLVVGGPLGFGLVQAAANRDLAAVNAELRDAKRDLEDVNDELRAAKDEVEEVNEGLKDALAQAEVERSRAERNFESATEAVDVLLERVSEHALEDVPYMELLRRELLEEALAFHERFLDEPGSDGRVAYRAAVASIKAGKIQRNLGDSSVAERSLRAGVEDLGALLAAGESPPLTGRMLVHGMAELAGVLLDQGRNSDVLELCARALSLIDDLQRDGDPGWLVARASVARTRSSALKAMGRLAEAAEVSRQEIEWLEVALSAEPEDVVLAVRLAGALNERGHILRLSGADGESEAAYRRGVEVMKAVVADRPGQRVYRATLANLQTGLAVSLSRNQRYGEAQELRDDAIETFARLVDEYPRIQFYRVELVANLTNRAVDFARNGDLDGAEPYFSRALEMQEELVAQEPGMPRRWSVLGSCRNNLAHVALNRREYGKALGFVLGAIEAQEQALERLPDDLPTLEKISNHLLVLVHVRLGLGEIEEAGRVADSIGARNPTSVECRVSGGALARCAVHALEAGDGDLAAELAERARGRLAEALERSSEAAAWNAKLSAELAADPMDVAAVRELLPSF